MAALLRLDRDDEEEREKLRAKLSLINEVPMDRSFRVLIPRYLLDYAGLKPNGPCVLSGMGMHFDLVTAELFDQRMQNFLKNYDKIASKKKPAEKTAAAPEVKTEP
jgi:DNA-binding transcriptional regulator/RsmH inhibitor MraZ